MDLVLFVFFSSLEYAAIVLLLLAIFRLPMKDYVVPVLAIAVLESVFSYVLRYNTHFVNFSVSLQIALMILLFIYFSRIQLFYSSIAVILSYCAYSTIQIICFAIMNYIGAFELEQLTKEIVEGVTLIGYILQLITVIVTLGIAVIIKRTNMGWQFIPDAHRKVSLNDPINFALLITVITSYLLLSLMVFLSTLANREYILVLLVFLTFCLCSLVHFSNKKEEMNDRGTSL
ncbi:hypothetical protein EDM57_04745 [Brevibacillus gelatini]|uniref:Uncharacterized protein n=1 Tax=Brevibacillus gelatini TaxID=1655277 RepID=A0A3M8B7M8_9BACL|nr:hypothetical protein [Brevibacillus gelatini]RNB59454.1 hypothetical protein EDM57_04745 [Brevibacillus gelatini]